MLQKIFSQKMLITCAMGFSAGLPLLLSASTLQAWMSDEGVDLATIGWFTLVGLPYSWKFLWAPLLDRFTPPFLGRRRGWLVITQIALACTICALGLFNPRIALAPLALTACLCALFSATQDMVIDAYRREHLKDEELALGSTLYVYGYRIAMVVAGSGSLILADILPWSMVFPVMGALMGLGILTTLLAPEPEVDTPPPKTFQESVVGPFREFFSREGAWTILAFVLLYKLGDTMASAMTLPFYLEVGFSKTQIGVVAKGAGLAAILGGMALGGAFVLRLGLGPSLWVFGFLQALSTAAFALLARSGPSLNLLMGVIGFENLAAGMGTAAYLAYMAIQTNKRFSATQYALLTSLMGVPRGLLSAPTGHLAQWLGWEWFFIFCALIALPGMALLLKIAPRASAPA